MSPASRDETFAGLKCMLTKIGGKNLLRVNMSVTSVTVVEFVLHWQI
jgi:hypothetical protein